MAAKRCTHEAQAAAASIIINLIKYNVIARRPANARAKAAQPAAHPRGPEDRAAHARRGARGQAPSFK